MPPANNLKGQRFGRLVAIAPTKRRCGSFVVWKCHCDCGNTTFVSSNNLRTGHIRGCGCGKKKGPENPMWNGGKTIRRGYVLMRRPDHPHANSRGYIAEHRLVKETELGRYLSAEEVLHHLDGDKQNNSPENLILFPNQNAHRRYHAKLERLSVYD